MDELISAVFTPAYEAIRELHPSLQLALVAIVLIVTQGPKILALRARWLDYRLNRSQLQYEKERLEVIKLHYEIEALKKTNELPTDAYERGMLEGKAPEQAGAAADVSLKRRRLPGPFLGLRAHIRNKRLWKWVERNPRLGRVVLNLLYLWFVALAYLFAFATISVVLVSVSVEEFRGETGVNTLVYMNLMYIVLTSVLFYWKTVFAHWRRLLDQASNDA